MTMFDPYRKWLGIPPEEQPPNHYRLLGVGPYESDMDVISNAADRQMSHVRTFQSGEHCELSQRILNELAAARVCLLDSRKKGEYDDQFRRQLPAQRPPPTPPQIAIPPQPPPGGAPPPVSGPPPAPPVADGARALPDPNRSGNYAKRRRNSWWIGSVISLAVVIVCLALLAWVLNGSRSARPVRPGASAGGRSGDGSRGRDPREEPARTKPLIEGRLVYDPGTGRLAGDQNAVVIALPEGKYPKSRISFQGIRRKAAKKSQQGVRMIRQLGGEYARADASGDFSLVVPNRGKYHLLMISSHAARPKGIDVDKADLAGMERYFNMAAPLIGRYKYSWTLREINNHGRIDRSFGRDGQL